jgi:hypothetical protein
LTATADSDGDVEFISGSVNFGNSVVANAEEKIEFDGSTVEVNGSFTGTSGEDTEFNAGTGQVTEDVNIISSDDIELFGTNITVGNNASFNAQELLELDGSAVNVDGEFGATVGEVQVLSPTTVQSSSISINTDNTVSLDTVTQTEGRVLYRNGICIENCPPPPNYNNLVKQEIINNQPEQARNQADTIKSPVNITAPDTGAVKTLSSEGTVTNIKSFPVNTNNIKSADKVQQNSQNTRLIDQTGQPSHRSGPDVKTVKPLTPISSKKQDRLLKSLSDETQRNIDQLVDHYFERIS